MNTDNHQPNITESFNDSGLNSVTPREWEVLLLLTEDTTNAEISDRLHITPESDCLRQDCKPDRSYFKKCKPTPCNPW